MTYQNLIEVGKRVFHFHPNDNFCGLEEMLKVAMKCVHPYQAYDRGAARLAKEMARYLDSHNKRI